MRHVFRSTIVVVAALAWAGAALAAKPQVVRLSADDGASLVADYYPANGPFGVVLAHGGRYDRSSWRKQAKALQARGLAVIAPDFRGRGESTGPGSIADFTAPLHLDVLAAVRYLRERGVTRAAVIGGSLGGGAAGDALLTMRPGEIDRVVFLGSRASLRGADVRDMPGRKLFIVARDDTRGDGTKRLAEIRADFDAVPAPRELRVVDGDAHAQALFVSPQAAEVLDIIVRFLADE